jgi:predicted transcriptional regulator
MAPTILGYEDVKKGMMLAFVNTGKDSVRMKYRLHTLYIGEPGTGKSALQEYVVRLEGGNSTFTSAADATTKGIIAVLDIEERILRMGPAPRAHSSICAIDEIGHMPLGEQGYLYSSMQQGVIRFIRHGYDAPLKASTTYFLSTNPSNTSGKMKHSIKVDDNEYPLTGAIKDRIDLFYVFRANRDRNHLMNYARDKIGIRNNYAKVLEEEETNNKFLRKFKISAQRFDPQFSIEATHMIMSCYTEAMIEDRYSPRLLDTLSNMCYAVSRINHRNIIDSDDVKTVAELFKEQAKEHLSKIIIVPDNPKVLAVEEMVKVLVGSNFKHEWTELLDKVCKKDTENSKYVLEYIGKIDVLKNSWKLRGIREELARYVYSNRDKILVLSLHPLTLAWRATYTGGDKPINVDNIADLENPEESSTSYTDSLTDREHHTYITNITKQEKLPGEEDSTARKEQLSGDVNDVSDVHPAENVGKEFSDKQEIASGMGKEDIASGMGKGKSDEESRDNSTNDVDLEGIRSEDIKRVHELNFEGHSQRYIAQELNITKATVCRILKVPDELSREDNTTPEVKQRIYELNDNGYLSTSKIADTVGVSIDAVNLVLEKRYDAEHKMFEELLQRPFPQISESTEDKKEGGN